jgi:mono/diheme cytochrome c family protein
MSRSEHTGHLAVGSAGPRPAPALQGSARSTPSATAARAAAVTAAAALTIVVLARAGDGGPLGRDAHAKDDARVARPEHAGERVEVDGVYATACASCHGEAGDGNGPAAFSIAPGIAPRPRDFTKGTYKLRSTPSGAVPTDADLFRTIARGVPRYMPAFAALGDDVIAALVGRIKRFSPRFVGTTPASVTVPDAPALDITMVAGGARAYEELGCAACHGPKGRGNGPAAAALRDTTGLPIWPADLAHPSWFKGGSAPADVYRTLVTGMDGTPMPGYADVFVDLPPERPWQLIAFIASLSRE